MSGSIGVSKNAVTLGLEVHGEGASIEAAIEAAEAVKRLLDAIAEAKGIPAGALRWRIGSVQFKCDGCGLLRPDRPSPDEGWTFHEGDDYCPICTTDRPSVAPAGEPKKGTVT